MCSCGKLNADAGLALETFLGPHKTDKHKDEYDRLVKVPIVLLLLATLGARLKVCKVPGLARAKEIICLLKKVQNVNSSLRVTYTTCL